MIVLSFGFFYYQNSFKYKIIMLYLFRWMERSRVRIELESFVTI